MANREELHLIDTRRGDIIIKFLKLQNPKRKQEAAIWIILQITLRIIKPLRVL